MIFSVNNGSLKLCKTRYWKLRQHKVKLGEERAYQKRLRELITDSVKRRLEVVSGPVGAELSGGLDSGVIDILINRSGRKGIYYSWSLDPQELKMADGDERLVIRDICEQEKIVCNYSHMLNDYGEKIGERMKKVGISILSDETNDFKYAFPTWSNTYKLFLGAQYVSEHGAKVMFTGHGGDEGVSHRCSAYEMYHYHEFYRYFHYIWTTTNGHKHRFYQTISSSIKHIRESKRKRKKVYIDWKSSPELLNAQFASEKTCNNSYSLHFDHDPIEYIETGGTRNRLDNIALCGALCKIRYMVPFLDYRVIDYAVSIPRYLYLREKTNRYIFREAFKDIMPETMYKLKVKADTSYSNIAPNPNWFDRYAQRKAEIINKLDREYWSKYLNFEEIDKIANAGKPTEEELDGEKKKIMTLLMCALAQNLVEKAKQ